MRLILSLLTTFLIFISSSSYAGGCDTCLQAAVQTASSTISSSMSTLNSAAQANVSATQALTSAVNASSSSINTTIQGSTTNLMSGLDAASKKMELAIVANTKAIERMSDHTVSSLITALKEIRVAEQVDDTNKTYGVERSQPVSGDIGTSRAALLKQGFVQSSQIWDKITQNMHDWNNDSSSSESSGRDLAYAKLLQEPESVWDPSPFVLKDQLTDQESLDVQKLLTLMINPVPVMPATDEELASDAGAAKREVERKLINTKKEIIHSILAKSIADKSATIPVSSSDWNIGYTTVVPDAATNKVSIDSMLKSETLGRLGSEGWYQDIKTKTEAGVLREQVYQQAINNKILASMLEAERHELILTSLIALDAVKKGMPLNLNTENR